MNRMDGSVCVVTGGTQGLGAAIARRLADAGAAGIVIAGRNTAKGNQTAAGIADDTGVPTHFVSTELGEVESCRALIARTDRLFGKLHVLVNAGALTDRGNILNTTPELFDRMFAVNTRAPFFLMQDAIRIMIREGIEGAICNIGSMSEHCGQPFLTSYSASKGALATLTRNIAFALLKNRIRVNQLNIGWMSSDHERELQAQESGDPEWEAKAAAKLPYGRLIQPAEAARAVNFMVSADGGLMSGAVINFDQAVWGASDEGMPLPVQPLSL